MTLCLDTTIVIDVLRASKRHVLDRLLEAEAERRELRLCSFAFHELVYGALISERADLQLSLVDAFVARAPVEPWSAEDAMVSARIRADLKKSGTAIGAVDTMISGQALNRGWALVTNNVRDFIRVPGLTVIDWSDPAGAREISRDDWAAQFRRLPKDTK